MLIFRGKSICVLAISFCLIGLPMMQTASAAIISTETAIEMDERQGRIDHINDVLARESVQNMMVRFGVDPADASGRVAALTDAELQTLEQQLEQLPAGGVGFVEVVGIVAIVLIILELLGVTNFFSEF
ncbi:MAG: hypothetical protein DRR11_17280 [Gammaproteobacteria bacterium]|nr:MAG: hypothetical protein DRR11_17280 [Gammaproteobacteria bacterium]RLA31692.1 MAG: hypothetical protein DRR15_12855 [Gammaproteobacteria bacterium]